jgi:hypothetical protein
MTIESPAAVQAGWYPDPSGAPVMRWWSGAAWTDHTAPVEHAEPVEQVIAAAPTMQTSYRFDSPAAPLQFDPTVRISDRRTVPWAPILFGAIALVAAVVTVLFLAHVFTPGAAAAPSTGLPSSITGSSGPHVYPANPALSAVAAQESSLVASLEDSVAGGGNQLAAGDSWPTALTVQSGGKIVTDSGQYLGMLSTQDHFAYSASSSGTFTLQMWGTNAQEIAVYDSATNLYTVTCPASDNTCSPA